MKLDPHEDKMRDKLSSLRINVDTDQLWSKLEEFVPEQKPHRPKAIFLLWPLLFLCISFGLFSPYRYASAIPHGAEEFQNEILSKKPSHHAYNEVIRKTKTAVDSDAEDKLTKVSPGAKSKRSVPNIQKIKRSEILENSNRRLSGIAENIRREVSAEKLTLEENKTETAHFDLRAEAEESRFIIEPFEKLGLIEMPALTRKPYKAKKLKRIIRPKPKQIVLSLGISGGAVIQEHLQAATPEFDILDKQKQTDRGRTSTGLQLGITYPLSKKIYVRSGLNYTRASTQLSISEDRYSRVLLDGIHGVWEDNQGNLHQVEGPVYATRKTNYQTRWTSNHHILDVPVSLGIRLLHYKRNLISIEAGAIYHMMHTFRGAVWDSEFYLNHDESVSENFNHNKISARAALEWEYRLSTTYSLFAGVQATDILLKKTGNDVSIEKRLYLINGIIGVKLYPGNM